MPMDKAPELFFGATDEKLTGYGGLRMIGRLVRYPGLAEMLAEQVKVKRRSERPCACLCLPPHSA